MGKILERISDNLHEILDAGKRASDLVRQILTFSRQTEHELVPVQIDLMVKPGRMDLPQSV